MLSIFSRKQVNQVNQQKATYYIPRESLELGPREIKSTFRNDTHISIFFLEFLEKASQPSQPP